MKSLAFIEVTWLYEVPS